MKKRLFSRVLSGLLCLFLLPLAAAAEAEPPVIHSDMTLRLSLHADGFPESTSRLQDWETFLKKLSLRGSSNAMDFLMPESRVYFKGGLYVNDANRFPFVYDGYHSYRYLISPAFRNESVHFQMHNFFEFMLKPYYFMDLPTQYIALFLYPEAAYYVWESYYGSLATALATEETRTIPYDTLNTLCQQLDLYVNDDPHYERMYFFFTSLLTDIEAAEPTLAMLGALEDYLDYLDPQREGMTITVEKGRKTYVLGERTIFEETYGDGALAFTLFLPNEAGQDLTLQYEWTPADSGATLHASLDITLEGKKYGLIEVAGTGLPCEGDTQGEGRVTATLGRAVFERALAPVDFAFRWKADRREMPYHLNAEIDWLHPATGKPALSLSYDADIKEVNAGVFVEGAYPQDDFFALNDDALEEYKERYLPTIALALMPVALEMPASVVNDIVSFTYQTGILDSLGIGELLEPLGLTGLLENMGTGLGENE